MLWRRFLRIFGERFELRIPVLFMLAFGGVSGMAQTSTTTVTRTITFPVVGLAVTETAQINVVNLDSPGGTANSCSGTIAFMNSSGTPIGTAAAYNNLAGGQIFSAALPFSSFGSSGSRPEFRGVVTQTETSGEAVPLCNLGYSLEIYDTASGVTHSVVTAVQTIQGPILPILDPLPPREQK
jgi:hypothetical protein